MSVGSERNYDKRTWCPEWLMQVDESTLKQQNQQQVYYGCFHICTSFWSRPKAKKLDIVAFFLCCFSSFSDHTVWSGPDQLMSQWNEPKHNNTTHMRTLSSVVGQMCLGIFSNSQTALRLDRNNMREDAKFQQNFSQAISSKNVRFYQRLGQADVGSRSHHKWMCKCAKAASSGRSRYAPNSIAEFMNGTKGAKRTPVQFNQTKSQQNRRCGVLRLHLENLRMDCTSSVPTRVKSKGKLLKIVLNFTLMTGRYCSNRAGGLPVGSECYYKGWDDDIIAFFLTSCWWMFLQGEN